MPIKNRCHSGKYENRFLSNLLSWILPLGAFFLIWRFAIKKMSPGMGVMSFGKSKAKIFAESETKVRFVDVVGIGHRPRHGHGIWHERAPGPGKL